MTATLSKLPGPDKTLTIPTNPIKTKTSNKYNNSDRTEWGASILITDTATVKEIKKGYDQDPYFLNIVEHLKKTRTTNYKLATKGHEIPTITIYLG